jgi:hypothetical protein
MLSRRVNVFLLSGYIAADCPLCGYVMIQSHSLPLLSGGGERVGYTHKLRVRFVWIAR